jgi:hypothetical protein
MYSWRSVFEIVLSAGTFAWGVIVFVSTQQTNRSISALNAVLDKEMELKLDSKRLSREKVIELMARIYLLLDAVWELKKETIPQTRKLLRETRDHLWVVELFIPNEILGHVGNLVGLCFSMINLYDTEQDKYRNNLNKMRKDYANLVSIVRKTYYFETQDSSEVIEQAMRIGKEAIIVR